MYVYIGLATIDIAHNAPATPLRLFPYLTTTPALGY